MYIFVCKKNVSTANCQKILISLEGVYSVCISVDEDETRVTMTGVESILVCWISPFTDRARKIRLHDLDSCFTSEAQHIMAFRRQYRH